ncbi:hypothetical protein G6F35_013181 [Rhizopus arrhizus]|nr:hypothetical protein G6F35_013181 [Rhizopus arrhizus]
MAYQPNTLKSFTPDSSTVGTSGIKALRALSATAMGRTLPDWISGSAPPTVANVASMRPPSSSGDRREVLERVIGQVRVQSGVDAGQALAGQRQGVAVGARLGDEVRAYDAARAGAVFDDDGLAQTFRQILGQRAGQDVGKTAGGVGGDQAYGLVRIAAGRRLPLQRHAGQQGRRSQ